jgi:hypothetical protein
MLQIDCISIEVCGIIAGRKGNNQVERILRLVKSLMILSQKYKLFYFVFVQIYIGTDRFRLMIEVKPYLLQLLGNNKNSPSVIVYVYNFINQKVT